ncbi:MAG TPA: transposase [Herpetosiphonaceae bacterium]|nr:transposase [Herpetosiphonaceae bacterium]
MKLAPALSRAQLACCARDKAAEAIRAGRERGATTCPCFRPTSSIRYDARSFRLVNNCHVSLNTLAGRITATLILGAFQRSALADHTWTVGGAELVWRRSGWYLHLTQSRPAPPLRHTTGAIGADLGIVNLCTTDDGTVFTGATVQRVRTKRHRQRQRLQTRGTRNAKRRLRKVAGKERRFQTDVNHCISKALVQKAVDEGKALRLEDLTHIRQRTAATVRPSQRRSHSRWAFRQLRTGVTYKAQQAGVPLILVDPRITSRRCFACGYTDKANRPNQATFHCQNPACGHSDAADVNAAKNIAYWAVVSQPIAPVLRDETQARRFSGG